MPKKKQGSQIESVLKAIWSFIKAVLKAAWTILLQITEWLKGALVVVERALKIIAIFMIAISLSILFLVGSLWLMTTTFGLKDSPVFQELRDRIANIYVLELEDDLTEIEAELNEENL